MSGRDHSYTCGTCGCERGGMNDLKCACDLRALAGSSRDVSAPKVRDLRVTDIRCACGAGPGDVCERVLVAGMARRLLGGGGLQVMVHPSRFEEFEQLRAEGWEWQEVDPADAGAPPRSKP